MYNMNNAVIYVGKSKILRNRLASYKNHKFTSGSKTSIMLSNLSRIEIILTNTEKEALILEATLIKKHKPKYNILLRDDKNYPFIKVSTNEQWPRIFVTRKRLKDGAEYFGPYSSTSSMRNMINFVSSFYQLRTCNGSNLKLKKRPCLNHQINNCKAPCTGIANHEQYLISVQKIINILKGNNSDLISSLELKMATASKALEFEKASIIRDQTYSIRKTTEKQLMVGNHYRNFDVIAFASQDIGVAISVMTIRAGVINFNKNFFATDIIGDKKAILSQMLLQYYSINNQTAPTKIILPFLPKNHTLLSEILTDIIKKKISFHIPRRGDSVKLCNIAKNNAKQYLIEKSKIETSWASLSQAIQNKLSLRKNPETIECLDISNISGKHAVGSIISFKHGKKNKPRFRHYKIKNTDSPDDYEMMREVIKRRFKSNSNEECFPDVFLIDGGKGQLNTVIDIAKQLNIYDKIEWLAIAKEKKSSGEKIFKPNRKNPIILASHNPVLLYMMKIRDESHRFGITFHRKLRNKYTLKSALDNIPGIGPKRKNILLNKFGSIKRIQKASFKDLADTKGISRELATKIYNNLKTTLKN